MSLIKGFIMSLGMFSIIPVPPNSWNDKDMPMVIPSLPLVGALIGLIWYGSAYMLSTLSVPLMIQSATLLFIPFILNGFIHADGYMDTADAVFSRRDIEERKRILKDPHVGAFAVIAIVGIVVFQFCAVYTIIGGPKEILILVFIPILSRCVAGIAMLNLKPAFETGYNVSFKKNTRPCHTVFLCMLAFLCLLAAWVILGMAVLPLLAETVTGILATLYLYKQFEGISGDLCGCIIIVSECAGLLCVALL